MANQLNVKQAITIENTGKSQLFVYIYVLLQCESHSIKLTLVRYNLGCTCLHVSDYRALLCAGKGDKKEINVM